MLRSVKVFKTKTKCITCIKKCNQERQPYRINNNDKSVSVPATGHSRKYCSTCTAIDSPATSRYAPTAAGAVIAN